MALQILSWLFSKPVLPLDRPGSHSEPTPARLPVEAESPPAVIAGFHEVEANSAELIKALECQVRSALAELEQALPAAERRGDPGTLLQDLSGELTGAIRRPPMAAQQALAACRDPDASLGRILETFHQDPALTQSLLKHANSPFYSLGGGSATSLREAAQRIGISGLHGVLMSAMVEGMLCRPGGEFAEMVQQIWTHMVRTAPVARRLGRAAGLPPETCYTLGLLHDLGKLIVFDRLTSLRTASRHTLRLPRVFLRDLLGKTHGPLGGLAALVWNLDASAARAIAAHPRDGIRYHGEAMSEVLCVAEWWDLSTLKEGPRDYEALWARAGLTTSVEACRVALDDAACPSVG